MAQDKGWKDYFADDARYADVINGIGCKGKQLVKKEQLCELDTQAAGKMRDMIRKAAFGVNFAIIGIESQEFIDYSIPLRNMVYDVGRYEKQAAGIRKKVRGNSEGLTPGEYLYGFRKDSRLHPAVTFILYAGKDEWNGPKTLHEMLNFSDIPAELQEMTADYRINLVEIRKLEDTSIFRTDVRQVFDFIRCSEEKEALKKLVEGEPYYRHMDEDAFDLVVQYTNTTELVEKKNYYMEDGGKVDMCTAITELISDGRTEGMKIGRAEGIKTGRAEGIKTGRAEGLRTGRAEGLRTGRDEKTRIIVRNMINRNMKDEDIRAIAECGQELIDEVREEK